MRTYAGHPVAESTEEWRVVVVANGVPFDDTGPNPGPPPPDTDPEYPEFLRLPHLVVFIAADFDEIEIWAKQ